MRKPSLIFAVAALAGVAFSVFRWGPSTASAFGGGGSPHVEVTNTVQTEARITGQTDPVTVAGTVALDSSSLDTLISATSLGNCTYVDGDPTATIGTTAATIPASPMANRTAMTIWNHSSNRLLICSASGAATTTQGIYIYEGGQWWKWEGLGAGVTISCRCSTGTCTYGFLEERCYQ